MAQEVCIWCLKDDGGVTEEHVIPDAFGGNEPRRVFSRGEVCARCNNELSQLDTFLAAEFDAMRFFHGVKGKKNRHAKVSSRGNFTAGLKNGKPHLEVNMSKQKQHGFDKVLSPFNPSRPRDFKLEFGAPAADGTAKFSLCGAMQTNRRFTRCIHKVAMNCFADLRGAHTARRPFYDSVRSFVRHDTGDRRAIIMAQTIPGWHLGAFVFDLPIMAHTAAVTLGTFDFLVDLSPDQRAQPFMVTEFLREIGPKGWTELPTY